MSGPPDDKPLANGADSAPRSLREIAEESWDQTIEEAGADDGDALETPADTRARDEHGRFVSKEASPGEQSQDPAQAAVAPPAQQPIQPPPGSSNEPPAHWSAEDKATFAKLPQEGRDFLLRRHGEMERDYQGKVQASASAVNFVQALGPIFSDPVIHQSLADAGVNPYQAIEQWGAFHKRAMDPNIQVRTDLLKELAQKMAVDPAAAFGPKPSTPSPDNLPPEVQQNPVFRYLADQLGSAMNDVKSLRGELDSIRSTGERQRQDEVLRVTRQSIDQFADEADAQGNRLRPHFDKVLPDLMTLVHANPNIDMKQAYDTACWMNAEVRNLMLNAGKQSQQQQDNLKRAQAAARSNVRGLTTPVSKPAPPDDGKPKGLRATLLESAEEVGYEG